MRSLIGSLRLVRHRCRLAWRALFPGAARQHYGDEGTIHQTGEVNVEVDRHGRVVGVWFRCALLPFTESVVSWERARDMRHAYQRAAFPRIAAIDFVRPAASTTPAPEKAA